MGLHYRLGFSTMIGLQDLPQMDHSRRFGILLPRGRLRGQLAKECEVVEISDSPSWSARVAAEDEVVEEEEERTEGGASA
eukprot:g70377.t1